MPQFTFALVKSAAVARGHTSLIVGMISSSSRLGLVALRCLHLTQTQASSLYAEHAGRPYYDGLIGSVTGHAGVVAMVLEGTDAVADWRSMLGPTDPSSARDSAPNSIRSLCGRDLPDNAAHGSDSVTSAWREIGIIFPDFDANA